MLTCRLTRNERRWRSSSAVAATSTLFRMPLTSRLVSVVRAESGTRLSADSLLQLATLRCLRDLDRTGRLSSDVSVQLEASRLCRHVRLDSSPASSAAR